MKYFATIIALVITTLQPVNTQTTTVNPAICGTKTCNGTIFEGSALVSNIAVPQWQCWQVDKRVTTCAVSSFVPVSSTVLMKTLCHGDFKFSIKTTEYWLKDTGMRRLEGENWVDIGSIEPFRNYLARLRPNEGNGTFYCWSDTNSAVPKAFFYDSNSTYFDVVTLADGTVTEQTQTVSQYSAYPTLYVTSTEPGCTSSICCWLQDTYNGTGVMTVTEYYYDGSQWSVWSSGSYTTYSGEFSPRMIDCLQYLANFDWQLLNGTRRYSFINGSIYELSVSAGTVINEMSPNWQYLADTDTDPLATGGFYFSKFSQYHNKMVGMYRNMSGDYWCNIQSGQLKYQRLPPICQQPPTPTGNGSPSCTTTDERYHSSHMLVCDPGISNFCGSGYKCVTFPAGFEINCRMGVCMPDYDQACQLTTTTRASTTPSPSTTTTTAESTVTTTTVTTTTGPTTTGPTTTTTTAAATTTAETTTAAATTTTAASYQPYTRKFGEHCYFGTDCYTGICSNSQCSCSLCTKFLPEIYYSMSHKVLYYMERCIPTNSSVGSVGDACDMWPSVKQRYCGMGMVCTKCPEVWNSQFAYSKCVSMSLKRLADTTEQTFGESCQSMTCGYNAQCNMISGIPTCVCPKGYNLEPNQVDCYGWKLESAGSCSVTCGNGRKQMTRFCDKASGSTAVCDGNAVIYLPCGATSGQCPIMTVELFDTYIKERFKLKLSELLSKRCVSSSTNYNDCCPGKDYIWYLADTPDCIGENEIIVDNEYSDGTQFSFYLMVKVKKVSICCQDMSATTPAAGRRKRATATTTDLDQTVLETAFTETEISASVTSVMQYVDPNIVGITVTKASELNTIESGATDPSLLDTSGVLENWAVALITAFGAILVVLIGVGLIFFIIKKNTGKDKKISPNASNECREQREMTARQHLPPVIPPPNYGHGPQASAHMHPQQQQRLATAGMH